MDGSSNSKKTPALAAFQHRDFRYYVSARFLGLSSLIMLNVGMGQYLYELTKSPFYLGLVGLSFFFPKFLLTLIAGHVADRYDRRQIILTCRITQWIAVLFLLGLMWSGIHSLPLLYGILVFLGIAIAFDGPPSQSIVPELVHIEHLSNAVTWNSSIVQLSFIIGPVVAGFLYATPQGIMMVLYVVAVMRLGSAVLVFFIQNRSKQLDVSEPSWEVMIAGVRYVLKKKILLGTMSLDLFAVLLGGAVALLPVYANDILHVGARGLGYLRAAPAVGATLIAILVANRPFVKRAGSTMFFCVAVFGLATILFGISKNFYFSLVCLFFLGCADMVSVIIRGVLIQIATPPAMRGRVSAINFIFIGASNELGEFESGVTASWFGVVPAVVIGGIGTLAIVAAWWNLFPEIREIKRLDETV